MVTFEMVYLITFSLEIGAYHLSHPYPNSDQERFTGPPPPPIPMYNPFVEGVLKPLDHIVNFFDTKYYNAPPKTNLDNFNRYVSDYSYGVSANNKWVENDFQRNPGYNKQPQEPLSSIHGLKTEPTAEEQDDKHDSESNLEFTTTATLEKDPFQVIENASKITDHNTTKDGNVTSEKPQALNANVFVQPFVTAPDEPVHIDNSHKVETILNESPKVQAALDSQPGVDLKDIKNLFNFTSGLKENVSMDVHELNKEVFRENLLKIETLSKNISIPTVPVQIQEPEVRLTSELPTISTTLTSTLPRSELTKLIPKQEKYKETSLADTTEAGEIRIRDESQSTASDIRPIALIPLELSKPLPANLPPALSSAADNKIIFSTNPLERLVLNNPYIQETVKESFPFLENVKNNPQKILANANIEIPKQIKAIPVYGIFAI